MKIMKIISDCGECECLFSDGISKNVNLYCNGLDWRISNKKVIPEKGIPDWCPLEDYKEQTK